MKPLELFRSLDSAKKGIILTILLGVSVAVGLSVYSRYQLKLAHQNEALAEQYRQEAMGARQEAERWKNQANDLGLKLGRANDKVTKLQAAVDKIVVPEKPQSVPPTIKQTLAELNNMGLILVQKPSVMVAPSVVGLTARDASSVWLWGREAMRVPALELKLEKTSDLARGLYKAKGLAESLAETKGKESDAWQKAADKHQEEAQVLKVAVEDTQKALAAQRKKTYLYGLGAFALGYVATRK